MDIYQIVGEHSNASGVSSLVSLNKEINHIVEPESKRRKTRATPYLELIDLLKKEFNNSRKSEIENNGLKNSFYTLITSGILSFKDILNIQAIFKSNSKDINDIRDIFLMNYTNQNSKNIRITIGSLVDNLTNEEVKTFFKGYSMKLNIYYQDDNKRKTLPVCKEGNFYSWGYADRVGSVGNFNEAPLLTLASVIN